MATKIEIECPTCNKIFKDYLSNRKNNYCSKKCYWKDKKGKPSHRKGAKFTPEQIKRLSESHMGQVAWNKNKTGYSTSKKGKQYPQLSGENNWRWIKDRSKLAKHQERNDYSYKEWRLNVYKRDNYKCKIYNQDCSGRIIAHHILGWAEYPELRYEINNGITLCQAHHPRKRAEEKRLIPVFKELVPVSN